MSKVIRLKNGSIIDSEEKLNIIFNMILQLGTAMPGSDDSVALFNVTKLAAGKENETMGLEQSRPRLIALGLLDNEGRVPEDVKNVLLSGLNEETRASVMFGNPIA